MKQKKKLIGNIPHIDVVMHQDLDNDYHVLMLAADEGYAVCKTHPRLKLAMVPNYAADGNGMLMAPLSPRSLETLLDWVDRQTALRRYQELAGIPRECTSLHAVT